MKRCLLVISCIALTGTLVGCRSRGGGRPTSEEPTSTSQVDPTTVNPITSNNPTSSSSTNQTTSSGTSSNTSSSPTSLTPVGKAMTTILMYICGSDLESTYASQGYGLATMDLKEILSVSGQPEDVNIVIETGGASKWDSSLGISSSKLERYHVWNQKLVKDASLTYVSMGEASTLQDFIEYGVSAYPAEKTSLIFWNHGNGMQGCCFDEKKSDDQLTNAEVQEALKNAFTNLKRTEKFEWIGYDCCLMQIQDIADTNSAYAKYMVASQESESGYGWDYDTWIDDLYAHKSTSEVLTAIVDGFIEDNGGKDASTIVEDGETYTADQTLSWLDLSYAGEYKTAWENMAGELRNKLSSSMKSSWNNLIKKGKHFAGDDYASVGIFDAMDFVKNLESSSSFNPGSSYTAAVKNAYNKLVKYNVAQKGAGNANGISMFYDITNSAYHQYFYTDDDTNFSNWKYIVDNYYGSSGGWGGGY